MCKKIKGDGEGQKESTELFFITSSLPSHTLPASVEAGLHRKSSCLIRLARGETEAWRTTEGKSRQSSLFLPY